MNSFRMIGNKVELYRYMITYIENDVEMVEGCISVDHKDELEKSLTEQSIEFTTILVDQTENEWFDGLEFNSYDEAMTAFDQGQAYVNASEVETLKTQLSDTDYKIIKCYEYQLSGVDLPYDIISLHTSRDAIREQIDVLQNKIRIL